MLGEEVPEEGARQRKTLHLLAVQWWSKDLPVPRAGWSFPSPITCFLDTVPSSGATGDVEEEAFKLLCADGGPVHNLWMAHNSSTTHSKIRAIGQRHLSFVFFATVDGAISWTGQTKSACEVNPVSRDTVRALVRRHLRQDLHPWPDVLRPVSLAVVDAFGRQLMAIRVERDRQQAAHAAAIDRGLTAADLPAAFKGNYFAPPALGKLSELVDEGSALPPFTLVLTDSSSAVQAAVECLDDMPREAAQVTGWVGMEGASFFCFLE